MSLPKNLLYVFLRCVLGAVVVTSCGPGGLSHQQDHSIDCILEPPEDLRVLRVTVPLGSVTVEAGPAGAVSIDAMLRHASDTAEGLAWLLAGD